MTLTQSVAPETFSASELAMRTLQRRAVEATIGEPRRRRLGGCERRAPEIGLENDSE